MTAQRTTPGQRAALRRRYRREMTVWRALIGEYGDGDVLDAVADAEALAGERRRVAAARAVLAAPLWDADDETESTICRCDWCAAEVAKLAATYRCRECGYRGRPMAWGCLDPENVAQMGRERGERYSLGNVTCPICGERELEADPWRALRAIRDALAADAPGPGGEGQG